MGNLNHGRKPGIVFIALCILMASISLFALSGNAQENVDLFSAENDQTIENKSESVDSIPEDASFGGGFQNEITIKSLDGRRHKFDVELALTPAQQERGLMHRENMPDMHGMLFVFGSEFVRSFWMKNTLIPLDIFFVEKDGRIQHIHHNAHPLDEGLISSGAPSYAVLELNGGMADKLDIQVGDYIFHEAFKNRNLE